jgi:hypothetical protein
MPLLLRQLTNVIYELEGFAKVRKLEGLRDVVFFDDVPTVHLCFEGGELLTLERGHPSTARNACFGRKIGHRRSYSTKQVLPKARLESRPLQAEPECEAIE